VGVFTRIPFSPYPDWSIQLFGGWMEHLLDLGGCGAWLNFPGSKVGKTFISIPLSGLRLEWALIMNRYRVRLFLIYMRLLTGTVISCRFRRLVQGSLNSSKDDYRSGLFFPQKYFKLELFALH
jgi:hypothetical protein